jgi:hypothetical protein
MILPRNREGAFQLSCIHNADACLSQAVDALATLSSGLKERLAYAAFHIINNMNADDVPSGDLRIEYEDLEQLLTRTPPQLGTDGSIHSSVRAMTDADAEHTARRILALAREVAEETWRRSLKTASASNRV